MNSENGIFNLIYNNINQVYDALVKIVQNNPSFEMIAEESAVHTVHVAVGKTLFSAGDELTIALEAIDENKTKMHVTTDVKVGIADNVRAKYGDIIQKLVDKMHEILPKPVMEEAPKPNNLVQVGELSKQMELQANGIDPYERQDVVHNNQEPTSVNQALNQQAPAPQQDLYSNYASIQNSNSQPVQNNVEQSAEESTYAYEPKPFDYESLKENESSKHQGNDPLQDLMKNL